MDGRLIVFDDLVRCVIDGDATPEEFQDLVAMMRDNPALQRRYCLQMQVHALLVCHKGQEWLGDGDILKCANTKVRKIWKLETGNGKRGGKPCRVQMMGLANNGWKAAAAAVMLLGGAAVWYGVDSTRRIEASGLRRGETVVSYEPAVRVMSQKGVSGLDLPQTLPGKVSLSSGEAVLKLQSGVELTVMGYMELEILNCMQVRLERGRLLVHVPQWATGFTVRTKDLEVYDLGTVFSVAVDESVSDVFVFKGSVQVNETGEGWSGTSLSGAGVGICEAGAGVSAKAGEKPVRFVADSANAQTLLESVKGCAALKNPDRAFQVAQVIADLWAERHMPNAQLAAKNRSKGKGTSPRPPSYAQSSATAIRGGGHTCSSPPKTATAKVAACGFQTAGMLAVTNTQASDLYFSAGEDGYATWDTVGDWRVYQSSGGGFSSRLPSSNDTVSINAATLAAENGKALVIGDGVNPVCGSFASGYKDYPGTACLRLEGGTLTSRTTVVIGMYYPGLAILEDGTLYSGTDFLIGGYGDYSNGRGVVTNNGAAIDALRLHVGHEAGTFGRLVHNGGRLDCRSTDTNASLQIGFNGGVGEFEANADFSTYAMGIGDRSTISYSPGTGTVTVAAGVTGVVNSLLQVNNGSLFMKGGLIRFQNSGNTATNLYVRRAANGQARISGWGRFTGDKPLQMVNNGVIVADGEGVERDLDFNLIAVVNNDFHNGTADTNGWYAVNKGRVVFPCTYQNYLPGTAYCWGDFPAKTAPELVNSIAFTFSSQVHCAIRGGFCASGRSDIPAGLPEQLCPVGVWCIGAYSDKFLLTQASFSALSLTFRYDQTQLKAADRKLRLYRHNGSAWVLVGSCLPGGENRISTDEPLVPVTSGDYNIGWFALMAVDQKGTVISIF